MAARDISISSGRTLNSFAAFLDHIVKCVHLQFQVWFMRVSGDMFRVEYNLILPICAGSMAKRLP